MTGQWPNEKPLNRVLVFYPDQNKFTFGDSIPIHRRRGGCGAVTYKNKIYLIGGITNGHLKGYQPWFDVYDPKTGSWEVLEDAPYTRDHFQAVINKDKLYTFAGRRTYKATNQDIS
ncbi:kelch repeat-containing protein [Aquimarina agarivorans]|uniref:kelch repeat-containing protein n=1 Tax=Aquimarina agarivorans TaxID=980584 RepID=UPI0002FAF88B|nr:kelch repeat-containing protein [Aquimarina agarivorans]